MIATEPSTEKRRGAFYTPRALADFLADWALRELGDRALDPACGEAVFLEAAIDRLQSLGAQPSQNQVVGFELNAESAAEAARVVPEATVIRANFFDQEAADALFEAVIGNPPWIRYHYFSGEVRAQALASALREGVRLTRLTSSWAPFVVHATTFLAPGGRLAFVLPAELLSTDYAASVREFLARRFASVLVLTFEERIFPGALVDAVLVLAEGSGPGKVRVQRVRDADALRTLSADSRSPIAGRKWTHALIKPEATQALSVASEQMQPLGDVAAVDIGMVTGANSYFLLTNAQAGEFGLHVDQLRRVVARGHQLPGYMLSLSEWEEQRRAGELVWLFSPTTAGGAAGEYIRRGEADGAHLSYKCRVRSPWWRVKLANPPDLILSYMSNHAPRLVANEADVLTTNLLHNVRLLLTNENREQLARRLALSWPNSATMVLSELGGRTYGGGVLKLETREAEDVLVPSLTDEAAAELDRRGPAIDVLLRGGQLEAATDLVDPVVLSALKPTARAALREAWLDLRARRKRRSSPAKQLPVVLHGS
jgi:adenine-specific DNA-methyltransferase